MATLTTKPRLKYLLHSTMSGDTPKEAILYILIMEFLLEHKVPEDRFLIFPQIPLCWKPNKVKDNRAEIADFGLGNPSLQSPYFKFRMGLEAKRSVHEIMSTLPNPSTIEDNINVMEAFHSSFFQGEDQAKAVIKSGMSHSHSIQYLLFVGPYWTHVTYGPFTMAQLEVRTHKPSASADFMESLEASRRLSSSPVRRKLYLLGTAESQAALENIVSSTDADAATLRRQANAYLCVSICYQLSPR